MAGTRLGQSPWPQPLALPSQLSEKGEKTRRLRAPPGHKEFSGRVADSPQMKFNEKQSHRQKPRHKQTMPHPQKFQHATRILIHQLGPLVVHVLGLSDRRRELSSWGWAGHPLLHEQYAGIQTEEAWSLIHDVKRCSGRGASLRSPQEHTTSRSVLAIAS